MYSKAPQAVLVGYLKPSSGDAFQQSLLFTFLHVVRENRFIEMNDNFYNQETMCEQLFQSLGTVYHICTPENHPIIFNTPTAMQIGMTITAICARKFPSLKFITFELMNNHMHTAAAGPENILMDYFTCLTVALCRSIPELEGQLTSLKFSFHEINSLENLRNVIAYINRNGAMVDSSCSPFSYLWGANRFFFNPEAQVRHAMQKTRLTLRECRNITRSRKFDDIADVYMVDGYASPMSFCDIGLGEKLFRSARHYFHKVSRHIESYDQIARLIGENVYYTDEDLFSAACALTKKIYNTPHPSQLTSSQKLKLAQTLHHDYNAGIKQLQRMLKVDQSVLTALLGSK